MGTTVSSIHIYTNEPIPEGLGSFVSFSEGWQTRLPETSAANDFEADQKQARRLSKYLPYPVLYFWEFDSAAFGFNLFYENKRITTFDTSSAPLGLFKLPPLIGYDEGNKRRLATVLSCADIEYSIAMLEEYLGVCLEVFYDLLDTPQDLKRERNDEKYRAYLEEEKRFKGKNAPIRLDLSEEILGKLEYHAFFGDRSRPKQHIFYLAYSATIPRMNSPLPAVEFRQGKLLHAEDSTIRRAKFKEFAIINDSRFRVSFSPRTTVRFTYYAPDSYRGKIFTSIPRGYYPFDFDEKDRLILSNERGGGILFMDSEGKIVALCHLKGCLIDYRDGYLLTDKDANFDPYGWGFDPDGVIRIYRIVERTP